MDDMELSWYSSSHSNSLTAKSKVLPRDTLFEAITKYDVDFFGIKSFANKSLFKGDSSPNNHYAQEDDRRARIAIRYILVNPAIL